MAFLWVSSAAIAQEIHFSPEERLDVLDAALIATAKNSIDFASYALTDPIVLDALNAAERRGVAIRQEIRRGKELLYGQESAVEPVS